MGPLVLVGLLGAGAFLLTKLKGKPLGGANQSITVRAGNAPVFSTIPSQSATVQGPSGLLYKVTTYQAPNSDPGVVAQLIGAKQGTAATQVNAPLSWIFFTQSRATGVRSNIQRGTQTTPQMLGDFGIA